MNTAKPDILLIIAKEIAPDWFQQEFDGEVGVSNYPGQTKAYQNRALETAQRIVHALYRKGLQIKEIQ